MGFRDDRRRSLDAHDGEPCRGEQRREVVEGAHRHARIADLRAQRVGLFHGSIADGDASDLAARAQQALDHARGQLSRAHDDDVCAADVVAQLLERHRDRGMGETRGSPRYRGFGAHASSRDERSLEQFGEFRAGGVLF